MLLSPELKAAINVGVVGAANGEVGASAEIWIFDGTMPALCSDADDGTVLSVNVMDATQAWEVGGLGNNPANPIDDAIASATGTATYFRLKDAGGFVWLQGTVGTGSDDITFLSTSFTSGDTIEMNLFSLIVGVTP